MVEQGSELVKAVVVLAAGVVAVPLFRRLGLGSVLGYLVAGLAIGPSGMGFFTEAGTVLHIAELGVVMFLFVIGLEMQPRRLWGLRREIFGIGLVQVAGCGLLLTGLGRALGLAPAAAFVAAMGFVLSSTAIVMQILDERGQASTARGQKVVSILLLEDLAIVPLLAAVAALAPARPGDAEGSGWLTAGAAVAAIVGLVLVARFLLNPLFRILAQSHAREVMTAAALLVVLGAALAMEWGGLSMALGAFAAGVMLSESTFRHQLEADIEPFRGILLGLFFIGVGMSLDLRLVLDDWPRLLAGVVAAMALKAAGIWVFARLFGAGGREATERAAMMAQGGEFAFVLYAAAAAAGIVDAPTHALLTAAIILSMALTPLAVLALRGLPRPAPAAPDMRGVTPVADAAAEAMRAAAHGAPEPDPAAAPARKRRGRRPADDPAAGALDGNVLIIGFGRFGQIASQVLLARGLRITIIEHDTDMIRSAADFGFHAYYGDGARMDVLHAGGAAHACAILVCTDRKETTSRIVELARHAFPLVPILARAYDRQHAISLLQAGAAVEMRETFESALAFGAAALRTLGVAEEAIDALAKDIRQRDTERLGLQLAAGGDITRGRHLMHGNRWTPTPLTKPSQDGRALNPEAEAAIRGAE